MQRNTDAGTWTTRPVVRLMCSASASTSARSTAALFTTKRSGAKCAGSGGTARTSEARTSEVAEEAEEAEESEAVEATEATQ